MYTTYILESEVARKTYVGYTNDFPKRFELHNLGKVAFTSRYTPWKLLYSEVCKTRREALKREKYFKSAAGRRWIKKHLF